jgi:hypothetical protein
MGLEIRKPRVLGIRDIFLFWLKNLEKEKPYLLVKRRNSKSLDPIECTEIWYTIKHELNYLRKKVLEIDEQILELELIDQEKTKFTSLTIKTFELKKEVYNLRDKIKQLSKLPPEDKKLLMTYNLFNEITSRFNKKAVKAVIEGEVLNLGNKLGTLQIRKIQRYNPSVNWGESLSRKQELIDQGIVPRDKEHPEGENWLIYRNTDYYLRWSWAKRFRESGIPMLRNGKCYAFYPTHNSSNKKILGAKGLLAEANMKNSFLHLRYATVNKK